MRRISSLTPALVLLGVLASASPLSAQESSIVGSWIAESWEGVADDAQPGLVIFTETNYSMMFVPPGMTREEWTSETPTDADYLAAFGTLVANSGRYTRSGNEITTEAYVALNPNYMANWGDNHVTYTFHVEGEMLHLTWPDDFGGPNTDGITGTFRKVG